MRLGEHLAEIDDLFGGDAWPYGLEANRDTLEIFMQYLAEQGYLPAPPPPADASAKLVQLGKAEAIRALAAREGYALQHCYAYSDSITDLPMLETVGHPTVVNPDRALRKEAGTRGWPVRSFSKPVSLRDRIPAPSTAAVATSAAVGMSALAAGALTYSLLRRFAF